MNFQDLFARYREMGAMAPQQSSDEQLLMQNQNVPPNSWALSGDLLNMGVLMYSNLHSQEKLWSPATHVRVMLDLPPPLENCNNEGTKKEQLMFKLLSPNTFRPFLMSTDEEHKQGLSGDEEVEELLQCPTPPLQQGWNLGLLKTNNLCKDYYKLTSNMLHTLIMGIKELTDGEISPAWQIAHDRGYQKQSNFSNIFLQDIANRPMTSCESNHVNSVDDDSIEQKRNARPCKEFEDKCQTPLKPASQNKEGPPTSSKESPERSKDMDGILELRKLLWRQIVPYTCLGGPVDPKQDGQTKMKLRQESRMKVVTAVGFGVNSDNYNCTFPETCQVSFKAAPQQVAAQKSEQEIPPGTPSMKNEQRATNSGKTSRRVEGMDSKFGKEDRVEEDIHGSSTSHKEGEDHGPVKTSEYSVSFPEEDIDVQLEEAHVNSREMQDTQPLKRSY
ncbi:unnamed protein product [Calypogeia fissa]